MLLYAFLLLFFGIFIGIYIERYRWVRAAKSRKSIGVDGLFYRIRTFNPDNLTEVK